MGPLGTGDARGEPATGIAEGGSQPVGDLPTYARKRRAQLAKVYVVFGRSPRSSMWICILSTDFWISLDSDMGDLLGLGESQRVACHGPMDATEIPRDDVRSR
jgi:hypothetical protein